MNRIVSLVQDNSPHSDADADVAAFVGARDPRQSWLARLAAGCADVHHLCIGFVAACVRGETEGRVASVETTSMVLATAQLTHTLGTLARTESPLAEAVAILCADLCGLCAEALPESTAMQQLVFNDIRLACFKCQRLCQSRPSAV